MDVLLFRYSRGDRDSRSRGINRARGQLKRGEGGEGGRMGVEIDDRREKTVREGDRYLHYDLSA